MKKTNKTLEYFLIIGIVGILLICPFIYAGYYSDYYRDYPAGVGPGETKTLNLIKLISSTDDGNIKYKVEITDGAGIASIVGNNEFSVTPAQPTPIPVRISIGSGVPIGTNYNITFKLTDITGTSNEGMIGFMKVSTITMPVYALKPKPVEKIPIKEKPMGNTAWVIIIVLLAVIIAIVAYFLLSSKPARAKGKTKSK